MMVPTSKIIGSGEVLRKEMEIEGKGKSIDVLVLVF